MNTFQNQMLIKNTLLKVDMNLTFDLLALRLGYITGEQFLQREKNAYEFAKEEIKNKRIKTS
jgi:hypothetical protein